MDVRNMSDRGKDINCLEVYNVTCSLRIEVSIDANIMYMNDMYSILSFVTLQGS